MKLTLNRVVSLDEVWDRALRWVEALSRLQEEAVYFTMTPQWMGLSADLYGYAGDLFHARVDTPVGEQHFLMEFFEQGDGTWRFAPPLAPYPLSPLWRLPVPTRDVPRVLRGLWDHACALAGHAQGEILLPVWDELLALEGIDNHAIGQVRVLSSLGQVASVDQLAYQIRNHHLRKKFLKAARLRDVELEILVSPGAVMEALDLFLDPLDLLLVDRAFLTMVYPLLAQRGWLKIFLLRMEGWLVAAASVVQFARRATIHLFWEKPYEFKIPFLWALSWYVLEHALEEGVMEVYNFPLELGGHKPVRQIRVRF